MCHHWIDTFLYYNAEFFAKIKNKKSASKCEGETKTRDRIQRMYGCFKGNLIVGCIWNCDLRMGLFDFDWPFFYLLPRTCWKTNIKRERIIIVDIFNRFLFMVIKLIAVFQLFFFRKKNLNAFFFFFCFFFWFCWVARNTTQQVRESVVVFTLTAKLI